MILLSIKPTNVLKPIKSGILDSRAGKYVTVVFWTVTDFEQTIPIFFILETMSLDYKYMYVGTDKHNVLGDIYIPV